MTARRLSLVFLGLTLSSSWGNGHATTYRALLKGLAARGHRVTFLERDQPWYAANRDLAGCDYCDLVFYDDLSELQRNQAQLVAEADAVILGSYLPEGVAAGEWVLQQARGLVGFYDIDTPITLARLERGDREYLAPELVPHLDFYLSFTGGPLLERLAGNYGARLPVAFHCMVDADLYRSTGEPPRWDLGYLGTYAEDRQPALERLLIEPARRLPDKRFVVAGPQYPADITWPDNVERIDHLAPAEHSSFYSRCRFTLNITREEMVRAGWSPSVRLFEAAACGSAILSDPWPGLEEIFPPGEALLTVSDSDDVLGVLSELAPGEARAMAERARQRVLAAHTGERRAAELEEVIKLAGAASARGLQQEKRHAFSR